MGHRHLSSITVAMSTEPPPPAYEQSEKPASKWTSKFLPAGVANNMPKTTLSQHDGTQDYLIGVRGCLAIMSFLWVFLQTFVPAAVAHSANDTFDSDCIVAEQCK